MNVHIVRVSVLQSAKVMAVLYFAMSIPLVLLIAIPAFLGKQADTGLFMLVLMPVDLMRAPIILLAAAPPHAGEVREDREE